MPHLHFAVLKLHPKVITKLYKQGLVWDFDTISVTQFKYDQGNLLSQFQWNIV